MSRQKPTDTNAPTQFPGTLQPPEEIHEPVARPKAARESAGEAAQIVLDAERYRPRQRPPIPLLRVLDDSQDSAEPIRVRKTPFRIGRSEGDLTIPLDNQMSGSHAELYLEQVSGQNVWHLRDLGSTNGTFVRVSQVVVKVGQVIMLGRCRFQLEEDPSSSGPPSVSADRTYAWPPASSSEPKSSAFLVDPDQGPDAKRYPLTEQEHWIGRDPQQCSIILDDPLISLRHARIYRDQRGRWQLENADSLNGIWTQIDTVAMDKGGIFQCGEQRFYFKVV